MLIEWTERRRKNAFRKRKSFKLIIDRQFRQTHFHHLVHDGSERRHYWRPTNNQIKWKQKRKRRNEIDNASRSRDCNISSRSRSSGNNNNTSQGFDLILTDVLCVHWDDGTHNSNNNNNRQKAYNKSWVQRRIEKKTDDKGGTRTLLRYPFRSIKNVS